MKPGALGWRGALACSALAVCVWARVTTPLAARRSARQVQERAADVGAQQGVLEAALSQRQAVEGGRARRRVRRAAARGLHARGRARVPARRAGGPRCARARACRRRSAPPPGPPPGTAPGPPPGPPP